MRSNGLLLWGSSSRQHTLLAGVAVLHTQSSVCPVAESGSGRGNECEAPLLPLKNVMLHMLEFSLFAQL